MELAAAYFKLSTTTSVCLITSSLCGLVKVLFSHFRAVKLEKTENMIDLTCSSIGASGVSANTTQSANKITASERQTFLNANAWRIYDMASEDDRRRHLLADARCRDVEPHRVTCTICNRSIGLHARKQYSLSNWYKHVNSCENQMELVRFIFILAVYWSTL